MRQLTIACDVDDVCADLIGEWLRRYNADYDDTLCPGHITAWDISRFVKPECGKRIYNYLHAPDLYDSIGTIPGAVQGIYELREMGHRVVFVTSCVWGPAAGADTAGAKARWLQRWHLLPPGSSCGDFIAAHDKTLIRADLLIDDRVENVAPWQECGILFARPHNADARRGHIGASVRDWSMIPGLVARHAYGDLPHAA